MSRETISKELAKKIKQFCYNNLLNQIHTMNSYSSHPFFEYIDSITKQPNKIEPLKHDTKDEHLSMISIATREKINEIINHINIGSKHE